MNITFYLVNARVLLGVKLHYNDNEKATSMRKSQRKQFRVRSSWNLGMAQNIKSHHGPLKISYLWNRSFLKIRYNNFV